MACEHEGLVAMRPQCSLPGPSETLARGLPSSRLTAKPTGLPARCRHSAQRACSAPAACDCRYGSCSTRNRSSTIRTRARASRCPASSCTLARACQSASYSVPCPSPSSCLAPSAGAAARTSSSPSRSASQTALKQPRSVRCSSSWSGRLSFRCTSSSLAAMRMACSALCALVSRCCSVSSGLMRRLLRQRESSSRALAVGASAARWLAPSLCSFPMSLSTPSTLKPRPQATT